MPLLLAATTCYVGTTPITKIYAGSQPVWVWGSLELRMVSLVIPGYPYPVLCAEFAESEDCADCAEMKSTYQYRIHAQDGWTAWQQFIGYRTDTNGLMAYCNLGIIADSRWQDAIIQLRTNEKVGQATVDLPSLPNVGPITPELSCS